MDCYSAEFLPFFWAAVVAGIAHVIKKNQTWVFHPTCTPAVFSDACSDSASAGWRLRCPVVVAELAELYSQTG